MKPKKIIGIISLVLIAGAGITDAVRYLQPEKKNKIRVQQQIATSNVAELVFVYNANGGIYPGIADFAHKTFSPSTYPCNLCYLTFGTFRMKKEWKDFLATLPYPKKFLHKDEFKRKYVSENLDLPVILSGNGNSVNVILSSAQINDCESLEQLVQLVRWKLNP